MKLTREFYIPKPEYHENLVEIHNEEAGAVVYTYTSNGKYLAMGFGGKRSKPDFHYSYRSAEQRQEKINNYFTNLISSKKYKAEQRKKRQSKTTLKVGDILVSSWGYEQTNVDFYEVTEVLPSGKSVRIRKIAGKHVEQTGAMSGSVTADKGNYIGEEMLKRVNASNSVSIASYASAHLWDGRPMYESWYG